MEEFNKIARKLYNCDYNSPRMTEPRKALVRRIQKKNQEEKKDECQGKARKLIKQAIRLHETEDGASDIGAYRDVVTEVLHFAHKKFKTGPYSDLHALQLWICGEGFTGFEEELEEAELRKLNRIPDKNLPLHSVDEFECKSVQEAFTFRLKGEPQWQGKPA